MTDNLPQNMELQIAMDLMQLCSAREYGLQDVRNALQKGHGVNLVVPDDTSYLVLLFLEQDSPWTKSSAGMEQKLHNMNATQLTMAMVQRGLHDTQTVARIFTNLMYVPDLDPRTSHILCHILHLVDVDGLIDLLCSDTKQSKTIKNRLQTALELCKRTRLRMCRTVIQQLRHAQSPSSVKVTFHTNGTLPASGMLHQNAQV